jgi:hypothetical protein
MPSDFWKPLSKLSYPDVEELKDSGAREKTFLDYKQFDADCLPMAREKLAPILASFANGGGGRLVFGAIEKNERIVGFEGAPKVKSRAITASIRNAAHSVQPPINIEVVDIPIPGTETHLFVVEVRPGQRGPFQYNGRYVQRVGDAVTAMPHTSVVHAVQAAQHVRFDDGEVIRLDRPILQGDGSDKWTCGVLLSPSYDDRRVLYDPFRPETEEIRELLVGRSYQVARQTRRFKARSPSGRDLELWPLGHVKVVERIGADAPLHVDALVREFGQSLEVAAACLCVIEPMLMVDIEFWVWSFDGTPLTLQWKDGLREVTKEMHKNPPPRVEPLHRVADLVVDERSGGRRYDNTRPIAAKAVDYIKLFIAEQDGAFR